MQETSVRDALRHSRAGKYGLHTAEKLLVDLLTSQCHHWICGGLWWVGAASPTRGRLTLAVTFHIYFGVSLDLSKDPSPLSPQAEVALWLGL